MQTNNPRYILIHCSDISSKVVFDQFQGVNRTHRDERYFNTSSLGFNVGYHIFLTGGKAYRARVDTEYGNHCNKVVDGLSMNYQSVALAFGVDGDVELPSSDYIELAKKQVKEWMDLYGIPRERVDFHRDFDPGKSCPGSLISRGWLEENILPPLPVVEIPKEEPKPEVQTDPVVPNVTKRVSLFTQFINMIKLLLCIKK